MEAFTQARGANCAGQLEELRHGYELIGKSRYNEGVRGLGKRIATIKTSQRERSPSLRSIPCVDTKIW